MVKVKQMPYEEKYDMVIDNLKYHETSILPLIEKLFGSQSVNELKQTLKQGIKPIPEEASFEEKYEVAYGNWIWSGKSVYRLIRNKMCEEGIEKFKRPNVEALKKKNAGPALFILGLIRILSPSTAFAMVAKKMAYQLQWLSPYSVSEFTRQRIVLDILQCKILDYPDSEDLCYIG